MFVNLWLMRCSISCILTAMIELEATLIAKIVISKAIRSAPKKLSINELLTSWLERTRIEPRPKQINIFLKYVITL